MSISSTNRKAGPYTGNGVTTALPFSFKVFSASDVLVVRTDLSGAETDLVLTTHYTVSLNADQDSNPGGTVNLVTPAATDYLTTITSAVPDLQPLTLTNAGGFYPKVINDALDRVTIMVQQLAEQVSRAVKVSISSSTSPDSLISAIYNAVSSAASAASSAEAAAVIAQEAAATVDLSAYAKKDGSNSPSGTWPISISGSAASATTATTATTAGSATTAGTASAIVDGAVSTSAKIADGIVTPAKLSQQPGETTVAMSGQSLAQLASIPSWATKVEIICYGATPSASGRIQVQVGASAFITTGYSGFCMERPSGDSSLTSGFPATWAASTVGYTGVIALSKLGTTNKWVAESVGVSNSLIQAGAGSVDSVDPLTMVRINLSTGGTFSGGTAVIRYR